MDIPVITIEGTTLPEVWERAVIELWTKGTRIATQYDREDTPYSYDATMVMVVKEPLAEPRIHLRLPTGLEDLEVYRQEVVGGIHDHWVGAQGWTYSYHDRITRYPGGNGYLNQLESIIAHLCQAPFTRRAQAITWVPALDGHNEEPPCLQRIWCRILTDKEGNMILNMNTNWRSRDAFKASFMNMYALTDLQRYIAEEVSTNIGKPVSVGRYVDISDSFHIYG
jgi:thymidylate synthase